MECVLRWVPRVDPLQVMVETRKAMNLMSRNEVRNSTLFFFQFLSCSFHEKRLIICQDRLGTNVRQIESR